MRNTRKFLLLMAATLLIAYARHPRTTGEAKDVLTSTNVLIIGAGISGLSAALEAARGGASVTVLEMSSVFGGHAVMSEGGISMVGTPLQHSSGVQDSPEIAYKDFIKWGEDANPDWVRRYVNNSRAEVHDWLTSLGVAFTRLRQPAGNSVPRYHETKGLGLGLVSPIYRECVKHPRITFVWNTQATGLITAGGRITGAWGKDLRTGKTTRFGAGAVILATGGFQNNLTLLRQHWPNSFRFPERILLGSGVNSVGSGHKMAQKAGAALAQMDHQWNYPWGLPDPRYPRSNRGLNARNTGAIWVNAQGKRFVNEIATPKITLPALLKQQPATYWAIFDEQTKPFFTVAGTDWGNFGTIQRVIFGNPELVKTAATIEGLAAATGLPAATLSVTVRRYNEMYEKGDDTDFGRFGPTSRSYQGLTVPTLTPPKKIEKAPFYAIRSYPLMRKSNGGVQVDLLCRVADKHGRPIPGLYAVGELTGVAGINGKAGLEGVWLGPGLMTGRVAARAVLKELKSNPSQTVDSQVAAETLKPVAPAGAGASCLKCHDVAAQVAKPRRGYWHFEKAHRVVLERQQGCTECHAEMSPYRAEYHHINRLAQIKTCASCHVAQ